MKRKNLLILLAVAAFLILAFLAGGWIIQEVIIRKIRHTEISGYQINIEKVGVNLFTRSLSIREATITNLDHPNQQLILPELRLSGIHYIPLLFNKKIIVSEVVILKPSLIYQLTNDSVKAKPKSKRDYSIELRRVKIEHAKVFMRNADSSTQDSSMFATLNAEVWSFSTDSLSSGYQFAGIAFERARVSIFEAEYFLPQGLYRARMSNAKYDSDSASLKVGQFQILTNFGKYQIGQHTGTQTDWLHIDFNRMEFSDLELKHLLKDTSLIMREARIGELNVSAFKDRRLPFPDKSDTKLPMDLIKWLPLKLFCDSLLIVKGSVEYAERVDNSSDEGKVTFNRLIASIYNLGNVEQRIKGKTLMKASARVMDEAELNAEFVFPNLKFPEPYSTKGHLGPAPIECFNPILIQGAGVKVNDGSIKDLYFNFSYDNDFSHGDLIFEYDNLDVTMLDKKDMSVKNFRTFLINSVVLSQSNLRGSDNFKKGYIEFERDKKKSIFNYWWKSIFSGLKSMTISKL